MEDKKIEKKRGGLGFKRVGMLFVDHIMDFYSLQNRVWKRFLKKIL